MTLTEERLGLYSLIVILVMNALGISDTIMIIFMMVITVILALSHGLLIIRGLSPYLVWGMLALIIGLFSGYTFRYIMRGTFYFLNGVVPIIWGLLLVSVIDRSKLLKVIWISQFLITIYCFIQLFMSGNFGDMNSIRTCLNTDLYSLEFFYPICFVYYVLYKRYFVSTNIDRIGIVFFTIRILICFSRTTIIGVCVGMIVYFLLIDKEVVSSKRTISVGFVFLTVIILTVFSLYKYFPSSVVTDFISKIMESMSDINANGEYNSYADAISNWRGYEIAEAINQWSSGGIFENIFGTGFGGLLKVDYMSSDWAEMEFYSLGAIPILHNGYFSVLFLGGIVGVASMLYFFLSNIYRNLKLRMGGSNDNANQAIVLLIMMMANTYVIGGIYSGSLQICWGILLACNLGYNNQEVYEC